ncbi:MAG TPA: SPOR domain-containing protein, partial [Roseiarcus sp.]|nr:SPOR domain-containing protein [Roseiarcus sp.]
RRLRSAGATQSGAEDPLAELTRLVNVISRENNKADAVVQAPEARLPKTENFPPAANDEPVARFEPSASQALQGEAKREPLQTPPGLEAATAPSGAAQSHDFFEEDHAALAAGLGEAEARKGRPRSWYFKTAGLAAIGVALLGGAAAVKIGAVPGLAKNPPFIAAAEGPTKIQPPSDATMQSGGDSAALLMKDSATAAPVKVVSTEEQPVDLRTQTPSPAPVAVAPAPAASPSPAPAAAAAPSPVAPAANTPIVPPAETSATVAPLFPEAKPVKTVSVRPDGTLISVDSPPRPPPAPPAKSATRVADNSPAAAAAAAAAEPATPKLDLPTKLSPPKSPARVVAKTDTTAPAAATETTPKGPLPLGSPARPSKATKTPPAKAATTVADAAATDAAPAAAQPAAADPAGAGGGWAVQFAAPHSEADAQSAISRLKSKYADALGGAELGVRQADVNGQTIYRVRAGGLSKADAAALCAKMKASGGDCFIAKN